MKTPALSDILERSHKPSFIRGLRIEEVSGVDHPAHEVEGWNVLKSRSRIALDIEALDYVVVAKSIKTEKQYTFGLLYQASGPGEIVQDAHGESISDEELYKARLGYVQSGDRAIHLQHGLTSAGLVKVGEWVDLAQWPYEVEAEFRTVDGKVTKATIPKDSVWMGVIWNSIGWKLIKSGQLRGLSLGGFRRRKAAEETGMAKQEKPIQDSLEGYTLRGVQKAQHDDFPDSESTSEHPHAPTRVPAEPASQFKFPQVDPKLIDHKPRLDRRFQEFLAGLEEGMQPDAYRAMLEAIVAFGDRALRVVDQAGHVDNLKLLASDLKKVMFSEADVIKVLKMGRYVLPEAVLDRLGGNMNDVKDIPGIGGSLRNSIRRGLGHHALSSFTGEEDDPIGMLAEKRKHKKDKN